MSTTVVHVNSDEWKNTPEDQRVYIGRANKLRKFAESRWANPHKIDLTTHRFLVIWKYEKDLRQKCIDGLTLGELKRELQGKVLGCWCKPKECHGDILARLAEMAFNEFEEWLNE